jgi:esterase/lipase superfamily enzyme
MKRFVTKPTVIPTRQWSAKGIVLLAAALLLGGCSSHYRLMPTPDVYALGIKQPYADSLPAELKTADANIMYVTDRIQENREDGRMDYGLGRDHSQQIGEAVVNIGGDIGWEALAADARTGKRARALNLSITSVQERARAPTEFLTYYRADGSVAMTEEARAQLEALTSTAYKMISTRLAASPRNEVLIYVHGIKTSFDKSLYTTAELWHFLGREFVPIAYSWPAGHPGLLRGYTYDRESSEFTVFHFKRFLAWLAEHPEVEGIHIISHSRGTGVVRTAIRELAIEARTAGPLTPESYKLRNVVVAAPDINLEVGLQRTMREGTFWAAERWTTYTSEHDMAIGASQWLFGGLRLGEAGIDTVSDTYRNWMESLPDAGVAERGAVIQYTGKAGGGLGHDYFREDPAVASDLVLTVRYGLAPGAEHGRPLKHDAGFFFEIDDDYLESPNGD